MNVVGFLLAIVFINAQAQGTRLNLSGVVTDAETHLAVAGASVSLDANRGVQDVFTDDGGNFTLPLSASVKPGQTVRLLVEMDGYNDYAKSVTVGGTSPLQIQLEPMATRKPPPSKPKRSLHVQGYVSTGNGAPVVGAEVLIHGGPRSHPTDKAGEFRIENITLVPDYGYPVIFAVIDPINPKVTWIVDDPRMGGFGRTNLPNPKAPPINLRVLKAGDQAFLQGPSIERTLGQRVYFFEGNDAKARNDRQPANPTSGALREPVEFRAVSMNSRTNSSPSLRLGSGTRVGAEEGQKDKLDWVRFLSQRAAEIRIPLNELLSAVEKWAAEHHWTDYQTALAALYRGDYDRAVDDFQAALNPKSPRQEQILMSLAYTEFKRGNFAESSLYLKELARLHPEDPLVLKNLGIVRRKEESFRQSKAVDRKRLEICRSVMGYFARDEVLILRSLFDAPMAASASEHGIGRLFDEVTKKVGGFELILEQSAESQPPQPTKYVTKSRFEKGEIEMVVSFDDNNLIDRITFLDPLSHAEWGFPR